MTSGKRLPFKTLPSQEVAFLFLNLFCPKCLPLLTSCQYTHLVTTQPEVPFEALANPSLVVAQPPVGAIDVADVPLRSLVFRPLRLDPFAIGLYLRRAGVVGGRAVPQGAVVPEPLRLLPLPAPEPDGPRGIANAAEDHILVPSGRVREPLVSCTVRQWQCVPQRSEPGEREALTVPRAVVGARHPVARVADERGEAGAPAGRAVALASAGALLDRVGCGRGRGDAGPGLRGRADA